MTTVCAVKKGNRLCIAADSLTCFGARKEMSEKHVCDNGKIIKFGPNYVGMSGHASWELILKRYFSKKNDNEWKTVEQIFDILNEFHQSLKDHYFLNFSPSRFIPLQCSNFGILVINIHGIFEIDYVRVVRNYLHFSAIGSGEEYALGAIKAVYDLIDDPEEIAKIGVEAAARFDRKTALPIHTQSICIG